MAAATPSLTRTDETTKNRMSDGRRRLMEATREAANWRKPKRPKGAVTTD